ncbi:uncharacterized protein LOC108679819 [Hyalella azteca]|uniref:Uncharacterized protein LOC108679819 n=1 Tax=Hyalella azteca TaxID=294128 RepID=A0A8B7PFF9_HYAAZ|nr:uncharacterized protein LOC108679819 [Hyalella azteca]
MCEVSKCCLCISLYNGCIISAFVTIAVSVCQTTIFSLILYLAYNSNSYTTGGGGDDESSAFPNDTIFSAENETDLADGASYSFSSKICPFGFVHLIVSNKSHHRSHIKDVGHEEVDLDSINATLKPFSNLTVVGGTKCVAPVPSMLCCMVVASFLYGIVGGILMIGVRKGVSQLLSIWFFYTVGYNILALVVGLLDGVYSGAADISSYVVCFVTLYCIVVVDSYYEKVLIGTEETRASAAQNTFSPQPGLVVVKLSPQSDLLDNNISSVRLLPHNGHIDDGGGEGSVTEPFLGGGLQS